MSTAWGGPPPRWSRLLLAGANSLRLAANAGALGDLAGLVGCRAVPRCRHATWAARPTDLGHLVGEISITLWELNRSVALRPWR